MNGNAAPPPMKQYQSVQEFHALYCPVKNTKSALFFVAYFCVVAIAGWRGSHEAPQNPGSVQFIFLIIVTVFLARWLVAFTCFRERLVFGLVIVSIVAGAANRFAPFVYSQPVEMVKFGQRALSLLGLLVSLTMLVQSVGRRSLTRGHPEPD